MEKENLLVKYPPQELDISKLEMLANADKNTKNSEFAILFSMSDGKTYTEKEVMDRVRTIQITAAIEVNVRKGLLQVSPKNYTWFSNWKAKINEMECPNWNARWKVGKKDSGKCPMCGLDLMAYAEREFPNLKKIKRK